MGFRRDTGRHRAAVGRRGVRPRRTPSAGAGPTRTPNSWSATRCSTRAPTSSTSSAGTDLSPAWVVDQMLGRVLAGLTSGEIAWRPGRPRAAGVATRGGHPLRAGLRLLPAAAGRGARAGCPPDTFAVSVAGDEVPLRQTPSRALRAGLPAARRRRAALHRVRGLRYRGAVGATPPGRWSSPYPNLVPVPAAPRRRAPRQPGRAWTRTRVRGADGAGRCRELASCAGRRWPPPSRPRWCCPDRLPARQPDAPARADRHGDATAALHGDEHRPDPEPSTRPE